MKLEPLDKSTPPLVLVPRDTKARRRSNVAAAKVIPLTLATLQAGVTLEELQALPVPVLAYSGQVTVHGTLPPDFAGKVLPLVNGYSHLTRNGNGSLGVKYGAIDGEKKKTLQTAIYYARRSDRAAAPWMASMNSQGLELMRTVQDPAQGRAVLQALATVPGVYGQACLMRCVLSGTVYAIASIGAIEAAHLWQVIGHFANGMTESGLAAMIQAEKDEREANESARQIAREAAAKVASEARETVRLQCLADGWQPVAPDWKPANGDTVKRITPGNASPARPVLLTFAKRGPRVCLIDSAGKGHALDATRLALYAADARAGFIFRA
jgi:hypothetical protein